MKKFLVLICFLLVGCGREVYKDKLDLNKLMKENEYIIVDVRTKEEYEISHIKGAMNIPHDEINENIDLDKNKIIFVYCESGNRSNVSFVRLSSYGYEVYNLGAFDNIDLPKS